MTGARPAIPAGGGRFFLPAPETDVAGRVADMESVHDAVVRRQVAYLIALAMNAATSLCSFSRDVFSTYIMWPAS